jgi:hypothetical protein
MITFNNIVERFEIFAENHFFIKSFSFGSPDDVDLSKFEEFPLMHLVYTGATYDAGTKTYNLEVYILDVPHDKTGKVIPQKEAISDSEQCAEDILADIKMGGNIFLFAQDYEVVNATTTPLEEETKNVLSGVLLDLSVAIPYEWDACNAPIDGVEPGGTDVTYARRGVLRMLTLDGATDVKSVRTIKVTNGTLTDDGDGVVTLDTGGVETLEELTDVNIIGTPDQGDVISYNTGTSKWMRNGGLQQLLARFKASGTGAQMYDTLNDTTKGYVDILANSATMKVNNSGLTITEASPGVLSLSVAAGTEGNEVEFEAFVITGSDTLTTAADVVFKYGSKTYWEVAGGKKIFLRALNTEEITVVLPSTGGQLALTTDIPSVPVDSVNGQTGVVVLDTGDIDENGNLYYTDTRVAANSAVAANTAKVGLIAGGTTGQALIKTTGTDYDVEWSDQYHDRYQTQSEALRAGATATTEIYYSAQADGDGYAQSASSDTPTAGNVINRKIYYSEAGFADPDTGTWIEFTPAPADDATFATVKAALLEYLKARTGGTVPISLKQTWEETTPSTYLLDQAYGSGAAAAYSTRQLRNAQTECMTIRRASDGTTTTIGFDGSGNIDEAAITTFCTGTTCTVSEWIDQSGNGNNATQATASEQPTIYTGGALVKENGKAALNLANDSFNIPLTTLTQLGYFGVNNFTYAASTGYFGDIGNNKFTGYTGSSYRIRGLIADMTGPVEANSRNIITLLSTTSNGSAAYQSGTQSASGGNASGTTAAVSIYQIGNVQWRAQGKSQEFILYNADKSSDRTDIEENIGDYFTQNTPLLDTYSGAAAAYSLRLLDSSYVGSAIRVRRSSDNTEQDIGFNVFGELDTVSLTAFAGAGDAFCKVWYDQSGSSNDATQTTTANQPKIYDGTTGVVTRSGKNSIDFTGAYSLRSLTGSMTQPNTTFSVVDFISGKLIDASTGRRNYEVQGGGNIALWAGGSPFTATTAGGYSGTSNLQIISTILDGSNTEHKLNNNTAETCAASTNSSTGFYFGGQQGQTNGSIYISEFVAYESDQSTNVDDIHTNQNTFYTIYS